MERILNGLGKSTILIIAIIIASILMCYCCCCCCVFSNDESNNNTKIEKTQNKSAIPEKNDKEEDIKPNAPSEKPTQTNKEKNDTSINDKVNLNEQIKPTFELKEKIVKKLGEETSLNFETVLKECNFDISEVNSLFEEGNWESGKIYSFYYGNYSTGSDYFKLYVFENGQICSINYNDIKIYDYSKSSLNVYDFFAPNFLNAEIAIYIQDIVNTYLNYPNYAKYEAYSLWECDKYYDYYVIYSNVSAPNAYGMYEDVIFRVDLQGEDSLSIKCVAINNEIVFGKDETPEIIRENKERNIVEKRNENSILLTYNQLGEYGKQGEYGIEYYLPAGTYTVSKHSGMGFFIENINNDDDYKMYKFDENGDNITITINDNYYFALMVNTIVEIEKQ